MYILICMAIEGPVLTFLNFLRTFMGASGERNSKLHIAKNVIKSKCVVETAARRLMTLVDWMNSKYTQRLYFTLIKVERAQTDERRDVDTQQSPRSPTKRRSLCGGDIKSLLIMPPPPPPPCLVILTNDMT